MATRVITKSEADQLGLIPRVSDVGKRQKPKNVHVEEIVGQAKSTKAGQFIIYEPNDKKSYQTQVIRIRKAFDVLGKPWPLTRPIDGGKSTAMRVLSRKESFERYPKQPQARKPESTVPPAASAKAAAKTGRRGRPKKK